MRISAPGCCLQRPMLVATRATDRSLGCIIYHFSHTSHFANKVSRQLVDRYGVIVFEDLNIKGMMQNHRLAKSIGGVAWGMLVKATESKAAYAGSKVVLVDPRNTSQMCSRCGLIVKKDLSERVHSCPECGLSMDRDHNAAINILRLGMQSLRKSDRSPAL